MYSVAPPYRGGSTSYIASHLECREESRLTIKPALQYTTYIHTLHFVQSASTLAMEVHGGGGEGMEVEAW